MYGGSNETRRRGQWAEMLGRNVDVANRQRPSNHRRPRDGDGVRNGARDSLSRKSKGRQQRGK
ncbi:hypothetical protein M441DRAFT_212702 [Trichoderma asperellum CBS 433.97]|uniref:Uncharacterized protein n=1 Tax=Trichoderma asperellum (strain ATCC 204424 / CBS 433.97 / NBRC 101777) TaxID=1042311 RepID=A0A2T3ZND1_TRIA4|nr:hypothetical protein M441DRAFT_212702 [Trichoderma asperellum CBS 433.97]PTB46294.1 hypothetical protein M441DRAFT_212702 [Trichoderma asperellum CBS 433.97]